MHDMNQYYYQINILPFYIDLRSLVTTVVLRLLFLASLTRNILDIYINKQIVREDTNIMITPLILI